MRGYRFLWAPGIVSVAIVAVGLTGCKQESASSPGNVSKPTLMLFCGAGIQLPAAELVEAFTIAHNCRIEADYAGSEILLSRLTLNRRGDLYMPGDESYVAMAAEVGMVDSSTAVCYFVPTILVAKGNPKGIRSLQDLTRDGVRLGLGDSAACAIGRTSKRIFAKNAIPWGTVEKTLTLQSLTVNELGIQIQTGSLDAVIVWDAVAKQYLKHGEIIEIPADQNIVSTVPVGVLNFSEHKALARTFAEFAASEQGRTIFRKHHYSVDAPAGLAH